MSQGDLHFRSCWGVEERALESNNELLEILYVPDSKVAQPLPGFINIQDFIPFSLMTWGERFVVPDDT